MVKKYGLAILISVIIIAALVALFLYSRKKNVSFDFTLGGNFANILSALSKANPNPNTFQVYSPDQNIPTPKFQQGIGFYLDVPLTTIISNKSAAAATFKNIIGSLSYNNEPILQTKADSPVLQDLKVPSKSSLPITDNVQVLINPSTIKFFTELVKGNKPSVKYNFKATLFGVPYSFTNSTIINK